MSDNIKTMSDNIQVDLGTNIDQYAARALEDLNAQDGLWTVKRDLNTLIARLRLEQRRRAEGMQVTAIVYHLVFAGPTGVGKTVVGRAVSNILRSFGVLKTGQFIDMYRDDFVSGSIGLTAKKTLNVCNSALDSVLLINEPYSFAGDDSNFDFGQEAIDTLLKFMEDHRDRIIVILAGDPHQMERFLASNPGLASHISKTLHFPTYSVPVMCEILARMARKRGCTLPDGFETKIAPWVERNRSSPDWGNAGEILELLTRMQLAQGVRLAGDPTSGSHDAFAMPDLDAALSEMQGSIMMEPEAS